MENSSKMSDKLSSNSCLKAVCSVTEMAKSLDLSRARFYQLVNNGKFPHPVYNIYTRRPHYTQELQKSCLQIRRSNVAYDNIPILFYSPRKKKNHQKSAPETNNKSSIQNSQIDEWVDTLRQMGLTNVDYNKVEFAIKQLYPDNKLPDDEGIILRDLFRYIKQKA